MGSFIHEIRIEILQICIESAQKSSLKVQKTITSIKNALILYWKWSEPTLELHN